VDWIYLIGSLGIISGFIVSAGNRARRRRQLDISIGMQMATRQQEFQRQFQQAQQASSSPTQNPPWFSDKGRHWSEEQGTQPRRDQ